MFNNSQLSNNKIDRNNFSTLRKAFKGLATFADRQSESTSPICNYEVNLMVEKYHNLNSRNRFNDFLWKAMHCFGKGYGLRCGEYANEKPYITNATLIWKSLKFYQENTKWYLEFTIKWSKTNKIWKTEILTKRCICHTKFISICVVHAMYFWKEVCATALDANPNSIVFVLKMVHLYLVQTGEKNLMIL